MSRECDVALAGGVSFNWLHKCGYHFTEGGILSKDGHTRPFDADASGTVFADGVAIVVLKRTEDAIADGDNIQAIILGSAVNNDGSMKVGFTAPSIDSQSAVVAEAMAVAGVSPDSIGFVEAHGTGTALGDPIEVEALQQVFRSATDAKQFCALGSLKSNIGHLNTVSGVAGLIKAAMAVKTGEIPPNLNFKTPNPKIDFANSPFFVPTKLTKWPSRGPAPCWRQLFRHRRNQYASSSSRSHRRSLPRRPRARVHVALVSAKNPTALDSACARLAEHLARQSGRKHRRRLSHAGDRAFALSVRAHRRLHQRERSCRSAQLQRSVHGRRRSARRHRAAGDVPIPRAGFAARLHGARTLQRRAGLSPRNRQLRRIAQAASRTRFARRSCSPRPMTEKEAEETLRNTQFAQPAIFAVSYALAKLWMSLGVTPAASLGHSIGEFVSACLAEVFSLEDALRAVAARGRLMQSMPAGSMLAVMAPAEQIEPLLPPSISIAAINTPTACVASGPTADIAALEKKLHARGISSTPLHTSHAFHSGMMDAAVHAIRRGHARHHAQSAAAGLRFQRHRRLDHRRAGDRSGLLGQHLRAAVQFHKGLSTIHDQMPGIFLEVGPGRNLTTLTKSLIGDVADTAVHSSLPHASARGAGEVKIDAAQLGAELWLAGAPIDWTRRYAGERRIKRILPTYPFERRRYWIVESAIGWPAAGGGCRFATRAPDWAVAAAAELRTISWRQSPGGGCNIQVRSDGRSKRDEPHWLVFNPTEKIDKRIAAALRERAGGKITVIEKGAKYKTFADGRIALDPNRRGRSCSKRARR